jgi:hypothetical protein
MEQHLCHAVVDGPDGHLAVALPSAQASALLMKLRHNRHFWCSRSVGGCGAPLIVAAGPILRPHFRHPPGSAGSCALGRDPDRAKANYTHLAIQLALVGWLDGQGFASRIEHIFNDGGRADLHVIVGDQAQTIEVQLSPMPETEWVRRDALYRSQVSVVTWLYGPDAEARELDQVVERDVALRVRADLNADGANVHVGTCGIDTINWNDLADCKLTLAGFWTPHIEDARAETVAWRAQEDAAARQAAEEEAERRRRQLEAAERERERIRAQRRFRAVPPFLPPFKAPAAGPTSWTLENQQAACPESKGWAPDIGWGWLNQLPPEYRKSARLLAYLVCTIDAGGPLYGLPFDDVPDPDGVIADALVNAGFIVLCAPTSHPRRWRRPDW